MRNASVILRSAALSAAVLSSVLISASDASAYGHPEFRSGKGPEYSKARAAFEATLTTRPKTNIEKAKTAYAKILETIRTESEKPESPANRKRLRSLSAALDAVLDVGVVWGGEAGLRDGLGPEEAQRRIRRVENLQPGIPHFRKRMQFPGMSIHGIGRDERPQLFPETVPDRSDA